MNKRTLIRRIPVTHILKAYKHTLNIDVERFFRTCKTISLYKDTVIGYYYFFPAIAGDSALYQTLGAFPWYYMPWKWEHAVSMRFVSKKHRVLEIGCGRAFFLKELRRRGIQAFGLDTDSTLVRLLHKEHIHYVADDDVATYAAKHKERFDVVCLFQTLEHVPDPDSFLRKCVRLMKKNGLLIVSVPNNNSFLGADGGNPLNMPPHHLSLWDETSLANLGRRFPLELLSVFAEPLQRYHWKYYSDVISKNLRLFPFITRRCIYFYCFLLGRYIRGFTILAVYRKNSGLHQSF